MLSSYVWLSLPSADISSPIWGSYNGEYRGYILLGCGVVR